MYEGAAKLSTATGDGTAVTLTGLADGPHTCTVVAFDPSANRWAASAPVTLTIVPPPDTVAPSVPAPPPRRRSPA
ncbi:hypothetical protein [Kitasatospora sp. NPDC090308]|uniref:hypothetical protein n=1 Tax=Kitasatospora sp. NPDC090308 TaxID=3364082 RepID=UPI003813EA45